MDSKRPDDNDERGLGHQLAEALGDIIGTLLLSLALTLTVNTFVARAWVIDGPSMQPNLYGDQRIMAEKITYRLLHGPRRGDVVVIDIPGEPIPLIKRVVAVAGDVVEVRGGHVYINGELEEEPWVAQLGGPDYPPTYVPPLHVFVLGDNRPSSRDSRSFGPVSVDQIEARALFVYWPPEQAKSLR